jgi:hypothetical protein
LQRQKAPARRRSADPPHDKEKIEFARALTRSLFGRFYWSDGLEREMREQLAKSAGRVRTRDKKSKSESGRR